MTRRVKKPVAPEKLRKIADFLEIAHGLPETAKYIREAAADIEYYRGRGDRLRRELDAVLLTQEHPNARDH